jgi:hypothetical protein
MRGCPGFPGTCPEAHAACPFRGSRRRRDRVAEHRAAGDGPRCARRDEDGCWAAGRQPQHREPGLRRRARRLGARRRNQPGRKGSRARAGPRCPAPSRPTAQTCAGGSDASAHTSRAHASTDPGATFSANGRAPPDPREPSGTRSATRTFARAGAAASGTCSTAAARGGSGRAAACRERFGVRRSADAR